MPKSKGFSLLETMVALLISMLISIGFFSVVHQSHTWSSHLTRTMELDSNVWLSPLLLAHWITPTGNNRWGQPWSGVVVKSDQIELKSDIDGPSGFPDAEVSARFESLSIRCRRETLQIKNGGGSFQPFLKNIGTLQLRSQGFPLLSLYLTAVPDPADPLPSPLSYETTHLLFFLRNYRTNLFAQVPR